MSEFKDYKQGWEKMQPIVDKLYKILQHLYEGKINQQEDTINKQDYSKAYTTIYNMCIQKTPDLNEKIYEQYAEVIKTFLENNVKLILRDLSGEELLVEVNKCWENYQILTKYMQRWFSYLDKSYINHNGRPTLAYVGIELWKQLIHEIIKEKMILGYIHMISQDRVERQMDKQLMKKTSEIFLRINENDGKSNTTYKQFEEQLLKETRNFYQKKYSEWSDSLSCSEYLFNVETLQNQEDDRFQKCLEKYSSTESNNEQTFVKLQDYFKEILIQGYKDFLIKKETGFTYMLKHQQNSNLSRVYNLYKLLNDDFNEIKQQFQSFVCEQGTSLMHDKIQQVQKQKEKEQQQDKDKSKKDGANDKEFIQKLFDFYNTFEGLIVECFGKNQTFFYCFRQAIEKFINSQIDDYGVAEILANYTDKMLRKQNSEKLNEQEIDDRLLQINKIFNSLINKDLYLQLYQKLLASRLLLEKSESNVTEKTMISHLKMSCGGQSTKGLEGMIQDISNAEEFKKQFQEHIIQQKENGVEFIGTNIKVLQKANWPNYPELDLKLPEQFVKVQNEFTNFYAKKNQSKELTWIHLQSSVEMNVFFNKKRIILDLSMYMALILLVFENTGEEWVSIQQISKETNLPADLIKTNILKLNNYKDKEFLLEKNPPISQRKKIEIEEDKFRFNSNFKAEKTKYTITPIFEKERVKKKQIDENRGFAIEASIVRIMKAKRKLKFEQIYPEVCALLKQFTPDMKQIKQKIEGLIEKDFLERDKDQKDILLYRA